MENNSLKKMDEVEKRKARRMHGASQQAKTIKAHLDRGHVCCLEKYKDDLPLNFVRCVDCITPLDKGEEIC